MSRGCRSELIWQRQIPSWPHFLWQRYWRNICWWNWRNISGHSNEIYFLFWCWCVRIVIDQIDPDSSKTPSTLQSTTNGLLRPSEIPPSGYFWPRFFLPSSMDFAEILRSLEISKSWVLHLSCETLLGPSYDQARSCKWSVVPEF